jgi:hypothetical protein
MYTVGANNDSPDMDGLNINMGMNNDSPDMDGLNINMGRIMIRPIWMD